MISLFLCNIICLSLYGMISERLLQNGFLQEVMKGWLISTSPGAGGDSTPWYASFWEFCARY